MKSPTGASVHTVSNQVKRAAKQADRFILDTGRTALDDAAIIAEVVRRLHVMPFKSVMLILKSGEIQRFDRD